MMKYLGYVKKMSLRECFYYQWKIWNQLPNYHKKHIFAEELGNFNSSCPSCEWDMVNYSGSSSNSCYHCPSKEIWIINSKKTVRARNKFECDILETSPYFKWVNTEGYDRQFFALLIADETKRLLQENL